MKFLVVTKEEVKTMCIKAVGGASGAKQTFSKLESNFPSLRGRKFYGVIPKEGEYLACTKIEVGEDPSELGLETYTIPEGKYATHKIVDWVKRLDEIGPTFIAMAKENEVDNNRPTAEFYRSFKELILMLPVR